VSRVALHGPQDGAESQVSKRAFSKLLKAQLIAFLSTERGHDLPQPFLIITRRYSTEVVEITGTDRELVARALTGDGVAWTSLVERYGGLVFATARKAGLSRDDAEDAAQTVFTSLLSSLASVRDIERLSAWLIVTTKREAWRMLRARRRHASSDESLSFAEDRTSTEQDAARFERRRMILQALGSIDERCQALLRALFLGAGEADYIAIGARFEIAVNSVGPIRNRCLRRLLSALESLGFKPTEHGFTDLLKENAR
jgi:RNA polymerase sigma factor (sigma-70 family)